MYGIKINRYVVELAGRFYAENNDADTSDKYILEARRVYQKWGAVAKVNALDNEYKVKPKTENREGMQRSSDLNSKSSVDQTNVELDINSLMKASLAISGEILLTKMVEKLMSVVIENAGAQIS